MKLRSVATLLGPVTIALFSGCGDDPPPAANAPTAPVASSAPAEVATAVPPPPAADVVVKRTMISLSRKSGYSIATKSADGTMKVVFDVLENGRGPHTEATVHFAPDGTIASFEAHGHHTMGTEIAETFSSDGHHAKWQSKEEHGEADLTKPAFFMPIADLPDAYEWLALAMIKAGGSIALLPGGTAHIEKIGEATVKGPSGDHHLVAMQMTGLDLLPTRIWMNDDGTYFGYVSSWFSMIPEGYEGVIEPLIAKQTEFERARDQAIADKNAHKPGADGIAFTGARVLDVEHGKYLDDQTIVVVGDSIKALGSRASVKVPKNAEIVDVKGKTIIPGLWDMHAHLGEADGVLNIASGVTTVRDVGNDPDKLDDWKARFDSGAAVGPHVYRMGFIEGRGEKAASSKVTAENETEAKAAVEFYAKRGYDGIKIYNSMKPELVPFLAKEAHAKNMQVIGHIPVHMLANEAVRAGYDGIEHVNMLFLNFFATHETDTRDTTRFTLVGEKAASFDLKGKPMTDYIALLKEHHTVIDPTLDAFEDLLVGEQGKVIPGLENVASRLPVQSQRGFLQGGLPIDPAKHDTYRASYEKLLTMVKVLHDAKIPTVVGTDTLAGLMLHHELALFVRAGLTPADVLRADTIDAARAMRVEKKTGSIAVGKLADFVVVNGDPLAHIEDAGKVDRTIRGGVVFMSAPLYDAVTVTH